MHDHTKALLIVYVPLALFVLAGVVVQVRRVGLKVFFTRFCVYLTAASWAGMAIACLVAALQEFPPVVYGLILFILVCGGKKVASSGWVFGTASWATAADLFWSGRLYQGGIPLGTVKPMRLGEAINLLVKAPPFAAPLALQMVRMAFYKSRLWVTDWQAVHTLVVAATGRGKTAALVIPYLLDCPDSMVIVDIKGELALITARHRQDRFGHKIVILDPYRVCTKAPGTLNPLDLIHPNSPLALDDAHAIAEALVVRTGHEHEPHWNDSAQAWIATIVAFLLTMPVGSELRNLRSVAAIIADPKLRAETIEQIRQSPAWGDLLAIMGDQLTAFQDRELSSVLTTVARHLRFLGSPAIAGNVTSSTFDLRELLHGKVTVYLVLPPDRLATQSALLRMWITSILRVITQAGPSRTRQIRFVLDEAAALGKLEAIENAVSQLRGYGLYMMFFFQSLGQLKKVFPDGQDQTFLSNMSTKIFFGTSDYATADLISQSLGDTTVENFSSSGGSTRGSSVDAHGLEGFNSGTNTGWSVSQVGRRLLQPSEVLNLDERQAVVFSHGIPPLMTRLVRYYEPEFRTRPRPQGALSNATVTIGFFVAAVVSVGLATLLGLAIHDQWK